MSHSMAVPTPYAMSRVARSAPWLSSRMVNAPTTGFEAASSTIPQFKLLFAAVVTLATVRTIQP